MKSRLFGKFEVLLASFVILISAFILIFLPKKHNRYSPPVVQTASPQQIKPVLNTYTNIKYGYTFQYQADDSLVQRLCGNFGSFNGEEVFVLTDSDPLAQNPNACYPVDGVDNIEIFTRSGNLATRAEISKDYPSSNWNKTVESILVGGLSGFKIIPRYRPDIDDQLGGNQDLSEVRVYNNGFTYFIYMGDPIYQKYYDQIIATFKFNKPVKTPDNWLNYENSNYHFRLQYPAGWHLAQSPDSTAIYVSKNQVQGLVDCHQKTSCFVIIPQMGGRSGCMCILKSITQKYSSQFITGTRIDDLSLDGHLLSSTVSVDPPANRPDWYGVIDLLPKIISIKYSPSPNTGDLEEKLDSVRTDTLDLSTMNQMLSTFRFIE